MIVSDKQIASSITKKISLEEARLYLAQLDLNYIIQAMCADTYPLPRWTLADAKQCERLYKNFLLLLKEHLPEPLVPTREIDEFWHNHILYTKKYTHDCSQIFGHYLHHEPADPNENNEKMVENYLKTRRYYFEKFNEPLDNFVGL